MSASGNGTKSAVPGACGARGGLKGLAIKAGRVVDPEDCSAAGTAPSEFGAQEFIAEGTSEPAQTRNGPRLQPWSVKPLLLTAASVFMAALGWSLYHDHLSGHIAAAEASSPARHSDGRAKITLEQRLDQERTLRRDLEEQLAARLAEQEALEDVRRKDQELLAKERARSNDLEQRLAARKGGQDVLDRERVRTKELEEQLAARQSSEQALILALARERAHRQALEQELGARPK
jgi:septal ring factor EnvC (AmiA/AmiB activator)